MSLHLVRLSVDLNALAFAAKDRGWTAGRAQSFDEGAALHHLLNETFGPAALQPFRLMVAPRAALGRLYAYTTQDPGTLKETADATAPPEVARALTPHALEARTMPMNWPAGRRIGIDVRLCPVVRLASAISPPEGADGHGFKKGAEVDAFLAEALRKPDRQAMSEAGRTREAVYTDWLRARLEGTAALDDARLASVRRTHAARGTRAPQQPDIVIHATLTIRDEAGFIDRLTRGIGRHKAYGYGMLLLRPPGTPARTA